MINEEAPIPADVFANIPTSPKVFEHVAPANGARWRRELSARSLPPVGGKLATTDLTTISRQEIFDLGDAPITVDNAFQLLYYSLAWGLGTKAPYLHKRLDHLAEQREVAGELLVSAWTLVRDGASPQEAYSCLTNGYGKGRIGWYGPAFSTKFLYFAQGNVELPRLLILDQVVSENLRRDVWPTAPTGEWWPDTYERYCNLFVQWAVQATEQLGRVPSVRADELELIVFKRHLAA
ncbi:hypothetical protein V6S67_19800 [Arthrobacter sp. Soc17.1.1.1]|uniref:8-oxoguanine DNA glycosylase OGG fold protein n=1 Tax=Arthrobacter sp. Soc17.1.1.1 TaxID=3121277 RepID=UPI002FE43922